MRIKTDVAQDFELCQLCIDEVVDDEIEFDFNDCDEVADDELECMIEQVFSDEIDAIFIEAADEIQ